MRTMMSVGFMVLASHVAATSEARAAAQDVGPKAETPNCVPLPLPTTPSGPSAIAEQQTSSSERVRVTIWRVPCSATNSQALITFTPLSGSPFVCSGGAYVIQNGQQADALFDSDPNNSFSDSLCGDIFVPTTAALTDRSSTFELNDDAAFTVVLTGISSLGGDVQIQVPAYDPAAYGQSTGPLAFDGKLSGSYYDAARSGEGVLLEIGTVGSRNTLFLSWYTWFQGQQRWIVGNVDFNAGTTSLTVPLIVGTGGQFGSAYDPGIVTYTAWGSATISFPTCRTMTFSWSENGGQRATYNYRRLVDGLRNVACP